MSVDKGESIPHPPHSPHSSFSHGELSVSHRPLAFQWPVVTRKDEKTASSAQARAGGQEKLSRNNLASTISFSANVACPLSQSPNATPNPSHHRLPSDFFFMPKRHRRHGSVSKSAGTHPVSPHPHSYGDANAGASHNSSSASNSESGPYPPLSPFQHELMAGSPSIYTPTMKTVSANVAPPDDLDLGSDADSPSKVSSLPLTASFLRARALWQRAFQQIADMRCRANGGSEYADKTAYIASSPILSLLSKEKQSILTKSLRKQTFDRGAVIYKAGDYPFLVYFLTDGMVQVETNITPGELNTSDESPTNLVSSTNTPTVTMNPRSNMSHHAHFQHPHTGQNPPLDRHISHIIDGWFHQPAHAKSPSSTSSASVSSSNLLASTSHSVSLNVPLYLLTAPDMFGDVEILNRDVQRSTTIRAYTPVTVYVLRRLPFRQMIRGKLQKLMLRIHQLQDIVIRSRIDHGLRMEYERRASRFAKVHSRLELTPFAGRAIERSQQVHQLKQQIHRLSATNSSQAPSITAQVRPDHHRAFLLAQSQLEHTLALEHARQQRRKERRVVLKERDDQYKFGFKNRFAQSKHNPTASRPQSAPSSRSGGRRILNANGEWIYPSQPAEEDSYHGDASDVDDADPIAATVWHAFPHAYSEAQWHVYSVGTKEIDPENYQKSPPLSTHQLLMRAQANVVSQELAKTDARNSHAVVASPSGTNSRHLRSPSVFLRTQPSTGKQRKNDANSALPVSASFLQQKQGDTNNSVASSSTSSPVKSTPRRHVPTMELNTRLYTPAPPAPSSDGQPILGEDPLDLSSASSHSHNPQSLLNRGQSMPLLSFFSMSLLRHLDRHYMRSTEVDPISYTGKWLFFCAPTLPDSMPTKPRPRKPPNWMPFSIVDEKRQAMVDQKLQQVLTSSPLNVANYIPPPPPNTSLLAHLQSSSTLPDGVGEVKEIHTGGLANTPEHWEHLSPRQSKRSDPITSRPTMATGLYSSSIVSSPVLSPNASPRPSSSISSSKAASRPSSSSSMRSSPVPTSYRRQHVRHPSLVEVERAYTFRVGHSDAEREVVSSPQQRRTDWQFDQLRRGRIDTRVRSGTATPEESLIEMLSRRGSFRGSPQSSTPSESAKPTPPTSHPTSRATSRPSSRATSRPSSKRTSVITARTLGQASAKPSPPLPFLSVAGHTLVPSLPLASPRESALADIDLSSRSQLIIDAERDEARRDRIREHALAATTEGFNQILRQFKPTSEIVPDTTKDLLPTPKPTTDSADQSPSLTPTQPQPQPLAQPHPPTASSLRPSSAPLGRKVIGKGLPSTVNQSLSNNPQPIRPTTAKPSSRSPTSTSASFHVRRSVAIVDETMPNTDADATLEDDIDATESILPIPTSHMVDHGAFISSSRLSSSPSPSSLSAAAYESFNPLTVTNRVVRKSLADQHHKKEYEEKQHADCISSLHPYPPKRSVSSSLAASQSHAYVYGSNPNASHAMELVEYQRVEHHPGSLTARRNVGISTAEARSNTLLTQLKEYVLQKAPKEAINAVERRKKLGY